MHFASANHNQGRELFQPIELQYSVVATWWKYSELFVKIPYLMKQQITTIRNTSLTILFDDVINVTAPPRG